MTTYTADDWRPYLNSLVTKYKDDKYGAPPEPIAEGIIAVETGETFDPTTYEPSSGAIGLGQITTTGMEWAEWKKLHPDADPSQLNDPQYNMDVMYYGLYVRHRYAEDDAFAGRPAAGRDWYMTAAQYLGGADESGFNDAADAYGTTGRSYVRAVYDYIKSVFGEKTAQDIDHMQAGTAFRDGYDQTPEFWAGADPGAADANPMFGKPVNGGAIVGGVLEKAASQVIGYLGDQVGALLHASGPFVARAGLFILGVLIAGAGVRIIFPPGGAS